MRTIIFTFAGEAKVGDLLMLSCRHPRGGESTVKCVIANRDQSGSLLDPHVITGTSLRRNFRAAEGLEGVPAVFVGEINGVASEWSPGAGDFKAVAKGLRLTVMASTLMNDVTFHFNYEGAGSVSCDIEIIS